MFTFGFTEMIVILIVIIIIIKPEDLPIFLRKIGRIYGEIKKSYNEVSKIKDDFINIAETNDIKTEKSTKKLIEKSTETLKKRI